MSRTTNTPKAKPDSATSAPATSAPATSAPATSAESPQGAIETATPDKPLGQAAIVAPATISTTPQAPVEKPAEATVTVTVPKAFRLMMPDQSIIDVPVGVQEMAPELADHWYAKVNGVQRYVAE